MQEKNPYATTFGPVLNKLVAEYPKLAYVHFVEAGQWGGAGNDLTYDADGLDAGVRASNDPVSVSLDSICSR